MRCWNVSVLAYVPKSVLFWQGDQSENISVPTSYVHAHTYLCVGLFAHARLCVCEYVELREYSSTAHFEKMKGRYLHAYNRSQVSMQPTGQLFFLNAFTVHLEMLISFIWPNLCNLLTTGNSWSVIIGIKCPSRHWSFDSGFKTLWQIILVPRSWFTGSYKYVQ